MKFLPTRVLPKLKTTLLRQSIQIRQIGTIVFIKLSSEQNPEECDPSTSTSFPIIIGTTLLLNKEQKDERSVATDDAQGTKAGYIKKASITKTEAFNFKTVST